MLGAGLMRQLTAGVYAYLPLAYRAMMKAMTILREEMNRIGGQEFHFPALNPESLWIQTKRRYIPNLICSSLRKYLVRKSLPASAALMRLFFTTQSYKDLP